MSGMRASPAASCLLAHLQERLWGGINERHARRVTAPPALSGHFLTLLAEQTVISFNLISALLLGDVAITLIRFSLLTL